ncbi:MAG: peptide chain release factor 1 [Candidatus Babeliales bacterium]|jgi:peptide chain release factor 1
MINWELLQQEYDQLIQRLVDSGLDQRTRANMQKRSSQIAEVLTLHKQITECDQTIAECEQQREKEEGELRDLYTQEINDCQLKKAELEHQLEDILYPADPQDDRSVFIEIRAGAGGQEAALFAADLFKMYSNYALAKNWQVSVVEDTVTDLGGFKELIMHIRGKGVYKHLKFESGVHRVQRVPKTEGAGRIHTSTVTVVVLPELEDRELSINQNDLRIDTYRAGGAGGQHVNKTDSAVRLTHIPTGLVVTCQDERSQIKNRQKAMKILQARLIALDKERKEAELSAARKQQVGSGERAEKIRTYNFPQNRATDHRIELTLKKLDMVMQGDLDDLIMPLIDWDRAERKAKSTLEVSSN